MTTPKDSQQSNKPIHALRIGLVKCAIWANRKDDAIWYSVTFERGYLIKTADGKAEGWGATQSMNRDDLLVLAKLADAAHSWIIRTEQART